MVPLEPSEGSYIIGIVENKDSERKMVQIDNKWKNELNIGMPVYFKNNTKKRHSD